MTKGCKNCGQKTTGNYCSNCGQTTHTNRIDLHYLIHEFLHGVLHVDKGIFYTIKELTVRPGQTIRDYLNGKRVNYFKPFGYLFILATVYTVVMHFIEVPILDTSDALNNASLNEGIENDSITTEMNQTFHVFYTWLNDRYAISSLIFLPFSALISFIVFYRKKYKYGEHLIINSYVTGHTILLFIIGIPFSYYLTSNKALMYVLFPAISLLKVYMFVSVFNNYKKGTRILLAIVNMALEYFLTLILVSFAIVSIFVFGYFSHN